MIQTLFNLRPPPSYQQFQHNTNAYQNRPQQPGISINAAPNQAQFVKKPEVRLYSNPAERSKWDNYADLVKKKKENFLQNFQNIIRRKRIIFKIVVKKLFGGFKKKLCSKLTMIVTKTY